MVRKKKGKTKPLRDYFTPTVKMSLAAAVLIGSIASSVFFVESRYAKADDVKEQLVAAQDASREQQRRLKEEVQGLRGDLRKIYMRTERRQLEAQKGLLQREQFDLVSIQQKRKLTDLEVKRLQTVTGEIGTLTAQIKSLVEKEEQLERIDRPK